jgi:hypothetical protein
MDYSLLVGIEVPTLRRTLGETRPTALTSQFGSSRGSNNSNQTYSLNSQEESGNQRAIRKFDRTNRKAHTIQSTRGLVHVSIIDYLQEWNLNKKLERMYKVQILQKSGSGLSAIEPEQYASRFKRFIQRYVFQA